MVFANRVKAEEEERQRKEAEAEAAEQIAELDRHLKVAHSHSLEQLFLLCP